MLDRPETPRIVIGLMYCFLAFFSLPFFMLLLMQGGFEDEGIISGIEIAYHVINFLVAIWIFKDYLKESFLNVRIDTKGFFKTVGTCVTLMITFAFFMFRLFLLQGDELMAMAAFGILPLAEVDLFTLSSYVIIMNPIFGTVCMVVLVPFSISCLYYATSFAPVCCSRPWLAYLVVAVVIAFPRVCNGLTYWLPME